MLDIRLEKTKTPKPKPDMHHPPHFGSVFTDHMFVMDYNRQDGWHDPRIVPYGPFPIEPSAMVFHYGQTQFEGMKAFKSKAGNPLLFRPDMNAKRFQRTAERICIPPIPVEDYLQAVTELVRTEKDWIPELPETSLYMRPVCFASEPSIGVRIADEYKFFVMCCPVKNYHSSFSTEDSCWIETEYVRSVRGSTGAVKAGGNYTGTLLPQQLTEERGYSEVLFLDGVEGKYIEEISASNIMFVIDGKMVTPSLDGSILPGITRDSILYMCRKFGIPCEERKISFDEVIETLKNGKMTEAISTGTAVVISPIGKFACAAHGELVVGDGEVGPISQKLYDHLLAVQRGQIEGPEGWIVEVK